MKVVSVINHKGGVGKTTLTANLGAGLAARGSKVLLVDLDAQGSLTVSFFTQDEWLGALLPHRTVKHWYDGLAAPDGVEPLSAMVAAPPRVRGLLSHTGGCLDLIAAHRDLAEVDTALAAQLLVDPAGYLAAHRRLRDGLAEKEFGEYDVALVDCAPNFGLIARNAVAASDLLLVPTRPDYLSTNGIDSLGGRVQAFIEEYNDQLAEAGTHAAGGPLSRPPAAVVFTMVQLHDGEPIESQRAYMSRVAALGVPTFETTVRDSKAVYGPAPEHGIPVILGGTSRALTRELRELVTEFATVLEGIPS
ncbi:MAG: ParA family protein [Mycobacteriales bacterium]